MVASCSDERTRRLSIGETGDSEKLEKLHFLVCCYFLSYSKKSGY